MSEKATQSKTTIACPTPLVLFGIDSRGKPKAARFGKQHAGLALKAATQLQLQILAGLVAAQDCRCQRLRAAGRRGRGE